MNNHCFKYVFANLLIDTGSQLNLIKQKLVLTDKCTVNPNIKYHLTGIGKGATKTLGQVKLRFHGKDIDFQMVDNDFPIREDGILGISFLKQQEAILAFKDQLPSELVIGRYAYVVNGTSLELPPRTKTLVTIPIAKTDLKEGYVPLVNTGPGIFLGRALVKPENGYAKVYAINTTSTKVSLTVQPVEIQEFTALPPSARTAKSGTDKVKVNAERLAKIIKQLKLDDLNEEERTAILEVLNEFTHQFHLEGDKLGHTDLVSHKIHTTHERPINAKQYPPPHNLKQEIVKQVEEMEKQGIVEVSESPYNAPVWIVPKKPDPSGKPRYRVVIDFREINKVTIKDSYPLPSITSILDQLGGAKYFSTLDLAMGFYQIPLDKDSRAKTAFSTPFNHYQFTRMSMGLMNSPKTFQRTLDKLLTGLQGVEMAVFMDDIIVYGKSLNEHMEKLRKLLILLKKAGLVLSPEKCQFLKKEVTYLGHIITKDGVKPDPNKIKAVKEFPVPKSPKNIKQFIGLVGYYRRFIPKMAEIAKPLTELLKKDKKWNWTIECQSAFEVL